MTKRPFVITVHPIIDREEGIIGPGKRSGSSGTLQNARKALTRHISGCLMNGPRDVAHITNIDTGEDHGWWFMSMRQGAHGNTITLGLKPVQHQGAPLTVQNEEKKS